MVPVLYIITFPFIIILLGILYLIIRNYNCLDSFKNYSLNIAKSNHFNDYIQSVHKNMYKIKVNNTKSSYSDFKYNYLNSLYKLDNKFNSMLMQYIIKCNILLNKLPIFKKYKWKFLLSTNNLEMNMPFTIDDTIIIPENLLNSIYIKYIRDKTLSDNFINTLIHEKIHIVQRFNQYKFNKFYKSRYSFVQKIYKGNLPDSIAASHMNNPDSNNQLWEYKLNNKLYYTLLKYENNDNKSVGIDINNGDLIDLDLIKTGLGFKKDISIYHPNEIFACEVAKKVQKKNLNNKDMRFLKTL